VLRDPQNKSRVVGQSLGQRLAHAPRLTEMPEIPATPNKRRMVRWEESGQVLFHGPLIPQASAGPRTSSDSFARGPSWSQLEVLFIAFMRTSEQNYEVAARSAVETMQSKPKTTTKQHMPQSEGETDMDRDRAREREDRKEKEGASNGCTASV